METCYFCGEVCNNSTKIPLCHKCDDGTKTLEDTTVPICESFINLLWDLAEEIEKDKENTTN